MGEQSLYDECEVCDENRRRYVCECSGTGETVTSTCQADGAADWFADLWGAAGGRYEK